jgi:hypothetical protein
MADIGINDVMDTVQLKNRLVDAPVRITFDGKQVVWNPGQARSLPRKLAEWFQAKSLYCFNPGDIDEGISAQSQYKLVILGSGQNEGDLTKEDVQAVRELLDTQNMPGLARVDPTTGKLMRRVYIDPRATGANDMAQRQAEERVTKGISSRIVAEAAEQIAEAAQHATEAEIDEAVVSMTGAAR